MERILVSSCLLGSPVRYHGGDARCAHPILQQWAREGRLVSVCPEVAGGLGTPRPPAEIVGPGAGAAVLDGTAPVRTADGADVTDAFVAGARAALAVAQAHGIKMAVLKDGSPSCASGSLYDGSFSGRSRHGSGVTAALLAAHGIRVFAESELEEAAVWLHHLEESAAN